MTYFLLDPTVVFTILVILVPIGFELQPEPKIDLIKTYLLHPPFLICCALIIILEIGALFSPTVKKESPAKRRNGTYKQNKTVSRNLLSSGDYMASRWYLMNGLIYHSLMDPICGFMQNWSLMTKQYSYLDTRFAHPYNVGSEAATLTVWLEGAVMCPLCVIIFIGYRYILPRYRNKNGSWNKGEYSKIIWIYCLEFIVLLCQSLGTYFFYGAEFILLLTKQNTHMPYAKHINELDFDLWENFYFWFGTVFMVGVWIVIPIILMVRAQREIANLVVDDHGIQKRKKRN